MFTIDSQPASLMLCDDGYIIRYQDGSEIQFAEHYTLFTNKYGDKEYVGPRCYQYIPTERPTYDELYEHWLKTK